MMDQTRSGGSPQPSDRLDHNRFVGRTRVAYFSMEIAISPEMPTYSGGLGILAGDTARAAADLDLPMVFVTLVSRAGYLRQELDATGHQTDAPDPWDPARWACPLPAMVAVPIAGLALIPLLFDLPLVFWPLHIAFLEMVIDPVCSIVFEAEGEEADTMRRPPRHPSAPLFTEGFVIWSLLQGVLVLALVAGLYIMALHQNLPEPDARSLAFAALVAANLGLVLVNRSLSASVFAAFTRPNAALWWVVAATAAILAGVILFPPARELFHFGPLHGDDIAVALASGLTALLLLELAKRLVRPLSAERSRQFRAVMR